MRLSFQSALIATLLAVASAAFAQGSGTPTIAVEQPFARATPGGATTGAAYMTIDNKSSTEDRLMAASSEVAGKVQVHEMSMTNGVMKMREVEGGLAVPANGSVTLKPGGYHVMLIGLKKPLIEGQSFPLTLTFAKAGNISVTVPVKAMGATGGGMGGMGGMHDDKGGGMGHMEMK